MEALFVELERLGHALLDDEGVAPARRVLHRTADLRYVGQAYEVNVAVPAGSLDTGRIADLLARFHAEHQRLYAHAAPRDPVEIVSARVAAIAPVIPPRFPERPSTGATPKPSSRRPVFFAETDGFVDCPVFDRHEVGPGARLAGPAIVAQMDSTTVVHPGHVVVADGWGNLLIAVSGPG